MSKVTVTSIKNMQQLVVTPSHSFVVDEPESLGDNLGPTPFELLLSALGT